MNQSLIIPKPLLQGDRVAIVSPAGIARREDCEAAMAVLAGAGFRPELSAHAFGVSGSFSGTRSERLADLRDALLNPEIKAVICSRGGYGTVHLLDALDRLPLRDNAKWLVGFSDISALHALMSRYGIASIHGPMAKHISVNGGDNPDFKSLLDILTGARQIEYRASSHKFNRAGKASGTLRGGNLAVLQALIGTRFDILQGDSILFIEDIAEPLYKLERMMTQLRLSGVLGSLRGLVVGEFKDCPGDRNFSSVEAMIREAVGDYDYPLAFGAPFGHGLCARPLVESAQATLAVTNGGAVIRQQLHI